MRQRPSSSKDRRHLPAGCYDKGALCGFVKPGRNAMFCAGQVTSAYKSTEETADSGTSN
jgi:hypothetical protein